eukprot:TRINITY_DN1627_c0_g2_i2.p1 TRINITY_DN1627_c0_g2~~TRINITY_DN1627_c0_g2_i2.p1  ORF type:complete len:340 (+),score=44.16 TRINITY_DN1627_c0_g2_i2:14-1033(+)
MWQLGGCGGGALGSWRCSMRCAPFAQHHPHVWGGAMRSRALSSVVVPKGVDVSGEQIKEFHERGFVVIPQLIDSHLAVTLRDSFPKLFRGEFNTGIYPDEWHWREGMSRDDVTREMVNAWKSDTCVARVVLSEEIGRIISKLMGWNGCRIAQDDIWWKPPGAGAVTYHQDAPYFSFVDPPEQLLTCWIALDETSKDAGTLEYIPGSHKWPANSEMLSTAFFTASNPRAPLQHAAQAAHIDTIPASVPVEVPAGGAAFHLGGMWHGSSANKNPDPTKIRRSLAIHALPHNAAFKADTPAQYIYGRYKRYGSTEMDETFFPITYTTDGYRSPSIRTTADNC